MSKILKKEQLSHISLSIEKKGVNFYDLNLEMTDHIASEVEDYLAENNESFENALETVFAKYDRFHFMRLEEEKSKLLQKQAWISFLDGLKSFFTLPKVVITILVFFIALSLLRFITNVPIYQIVAVIATLVFCALGYQKWRYLGWKKYIYLNRFSMYSLLLMQFVYQFIFALKSTTNIYFGALMITLTYLMTYCVADLYIQQLNKLKFIKSVKV